MNELLKSIDFQALYFRGKKYDQPTLLRAIDHLASYLRKNIKSDSPFILLSTYNHIKTVIAYYAILKAGKIAVILDPECKTLELSEIIEDVDPGAIIFINSISLQFIYEEEIIFRSANRQFVISSDLTDVCTIAYTNAEDGYSKGAMLTEKNLMTEIELLSLVENLDKNSTSCAFLPFNHLFGFLQGVLIPTHKGGSALILEMDLTKLQIYIPQIAKYCVTHFFTVPPIYYLLSKSDKIDCLTQPEMHFFSGGIKLSNHIYDLFFKKTGKKIHEGYGLTECAPAVASNYLDDPRVESLGLPFPRTNIKIMDDNGKILLPEELGEICVKGDMVFKGYFNHDRATKAVFNNGWFRTGDLGIIDQDGFLYFKGLKKRMINVAGNNIYPNKLIRLMKMYGNVKNIEVFPEESLIQGQSVSAKITLQDSSQNKMTDYKKWCSENITNGLLPKKWIFQ